MKEVLTTVSDAFVDTSDHLLGLATCFGAMLVLDRIELALCLHQSLFVLWKKRGSRQTPHWREPRTGASRHPHRLSPPKAGAVGLGLHSRSRHTLSPLASAPYRSYFAFDRSVEDRLDGSILDR